MFQRQGAFEVLHGWYESRKVLCPCLMFFIGGMSVVDCL